MSLNGSWKGSGEFMAFELAEITIGGRHVGASWPVFVIAEIGLNHGGSLDRALAMVDAAADAGASAVKLQSLDAAALVVAGAPAPVHVQAHSMREFFAQFELDEAAHASIVAHARARGLVVMATPLSEPAVDMLQRVGIDAFKIASGDVTWAGLIAACARTGKPLVISTGMSGLDEVKRALGWARASGASEIALLHCVSAYPVPPGSENLRAIATMADAFGIPIGLSDHGADSFAAPLAVALGASIYERHLVLAAGDGSIDAAVSSTPAQLSALILTVERARQALGAGHKVCLPAERPNQLASRRALYAARPLTAGAVIGDGDLVALRPGIGLPTDRRHELVGRPSLRDMEAGMPFMESDVAPERMRGASRVA
jgi:sialic acid synthase SpsE